MAVATQPPFFSKQGGGAAQPFLIQSKGWGPFPQPGKICDSFPSFLLIFSCF